MRSFRDSLWWERADPLKTTHTLLELLSCLKIVWCGRIYEFGFDAIIIWPSSLYSFKKDTKASRLALLVRTLWSKLKSYCSAIHRFRRESTSVLALNGMATIYPALVSLAALFEMIFNIIVFFTKNGINGEFFAFPEFLAFVSKEVIRWIRMWIYRTKYKVSEDSIKGRGFTQ